MRRLLAILAVLACAATAGATAFHWPPNTDAFDRPRRRASSSPAFLFAAPAASDPSTITPTHGPAFSCARTSTGTYQTSATTLATAASGTCRVDYRGLLVEESRTNAIKSYLDVSNAAWTKQHSPTVVTDQCAFPDGTTSMDKITGTDTVSAPLQTVSSPGSNGPFSASAWFSAVSGTASPSVDIETTGTGATPSTCICEIDSPYSCAASISGSDCIAVAQSIGTTPVRMTAIATTSVNPTVAFWIFAAGKYNNAANTGAVACIGGAQAELSASSSSSIIPTTTTSVTRAADQIDLGAITLSATPSLSATVNLEGLPASGTATALSATDGTTALTLAVTSTGAVKCSYGATSDTTTGTLAAGTASKIVCKYDGANLSACIGSTCHGTAATLSITAAQTHLYIGWDGSGSYLNGFASTLCAGRAGQC